MRPRSFQWHAGVLPPVLADVLIYPRLADHEAAPAEIDLSVTADLPLPIDHRPLEQAPGFRLLQWRRPFAINPQKRGFFDLAGMWRGPDLVMNRPNEQGIRFNSGLFIDHAVVTLRWATDEELEVACNGIR